MTHQEKKQKKKEKKEHLALALNT